MLKRYVRVQGRERILRSQTACFGVEVVGVHPEWKLYHALHSYDQHRDRAPSAGFHATVYPTDV